MSASEQIECSIRATAFWIFPLHKSAVLFYVIFLHHPTMMVCISVTRKRTDQQWKGLGTRTSKQRVHRCGERIWSVTAAWCRGCWRWYTGRKEHYHICIITLQCATAYPRTQQGCEFLSNTWAKGWRERITYYIGYYIPIVLIVLHNITILATL